MVLGVKKLPANAGDVRDSGSIPESERSPGGGHGNPLQYPYLENPTDRGAWQAIVHGVAKSQTRLSDFTSLHLPTYDLTWHDIYIILSSTLLPEEKERVWQVSQAHADEIHRTDETKPVGAVPRDDPNWDYQAGRPG